MSPTFTAIRPSVAARLYAGAVDATPMTMLEMSPSAPDLRPFSATSSGGASAATATIVALPFPFRDLGPDLGQDSMFAQDSMLLITCLIRV